MKDRIKAITEIAKRKAGIDGWEPFNWIGKPAGNRTMQPGDVCVVGGVPHVLQRGPRAGRKTWNGVETSTIIVTKEELEHEPAF